MAAMARFYPRGPIDVGERLHLFSQARLRRRR